MLGSKVKRMIGRSEPVPSVDDGAIIAALHIVWALRGRAPTRVWGRVSILGFSPRCNVVLAGGSGMQRLRETKKRYIEATHAPEPDLCTCVCVRTQQYLFSQNASETECAIFHNIYLLSRHHLLAASICSHTSTLFRVRTSNLIFTEPRPSGEASRCACRHHVIWLGEGQG